MITGGHEAGDSLQFTAVTPNCLATQGIPLRGMSHPSLNLNPQPKIVVSSLLSIIQIKPQYTIVVSLFFAIIPI